MRKVRVKKSLIISMVIASIICSMQALQSNAESLFNMSATQNYYVEPKSLFGGVCANSIGDVVTILLDEQINVSDNMTYTTDKTSTTVDNFTGLIGTILPKKPKSFDDINGFGGTNSVKNSVQASRAMKFKDSVTVQVVQLLPNGNLMVQGKKTIVNANERMDMLVSGVIDPRFINDKGQVRSQNVANLQFAVNGKGSSSRVNNEGVINRVIRYLF